MRTLKAFLLGVVAIGLVAYAIAAAVAVAAQAGGSTFAVAIGPVEVVSVVEEGATIVTSFGPGLLLLAFVGGLANLLAAWAIRRRAERRTDHVD